MPVLEQYKNIVALDTETGEHEIPFLATTAVVIDVVDGVPKYEAELYDLKNGEDKQRLKIVCEDPKIIKVCHPLTYDVYALKLIGIHVVPPWEDTLIVATYFNEYMEARALKKLARKYLNEPCEEEKELRKVKTKYKKIAKKEGRPFYYSDIPADILWPYAKQDAILTLKLWYFLRGWIEQYPDLYQLEKDLVPIVVDMEYRGFKLDREYVKKASVGSHKIKDGLDVELRKYLRENVKEWSTEWVRHKKLFKTPASLAKVVAPLKIPDQWKPMIKKACAGDGDSVTQEKITGALERYLKLHIAKWTAGQINHPKLLGSPERLSEAMRLLNVPIKKTAPKTGNLATDKETLKTVKDHPFVALLLKYRYVSKQLGTYFDPFLYEYTSDEDPIAHFLIWQAGAQRTGRFSADRIQTIPKTNEAKGQFPVRNCFIPRSGYVFALFDYSQIEMRIFAALSKSEKLIVALKDGFDVHLDTAFNIFGKDVVLKDEKSKKIYRDAAKTINFGIIYGMGPNKLAQSLGLSTMDAQVALTKYYKEYPVREFMSANSSALYRTGVVTLDYDSPRMKFKRIYRVPLDLSYKATNVIIQSSAAFVIKFAMLRIKKLIERNRWNVYFLEQVHDELLFEVGLKDFTKGNMRAIQGEMEDHETFDVPLTVAFKWSSKSWGEAKEMVL